MPKLLINFEDRQHANHETLNGAFVRLRIEALKLKRQLHKEHGCLLGFIMYRSINFTANGVYVKNYGLIQILHKIKTKIL